MRISHELATMGEKIKENKDKVKVNKTLPYLVANVVELLDVEGDDQEEDGGNVDLDAQVSFHFTWPILRPFIIELLLSKN